MNIYGHGIDIVQVERIRGMINRHGAHFLDRCFTTDEVRYAYDKRRFVEHIAGRFAAKEAVLKALGTGWSQGIGWTDVEVAASPAGQPRVELHGRAGEIARERGIGAWFLSISHTSEHASASAIACTDG